MANETFIERQRTPAFLVHNYYDWWWGYRVDCSYNCLHIRNNYDNIINGGNNKEEENVKSVKAIGRNKNSASISTFVADFREGERREHHRWIFFAIFYIFKYFDSLDFGRVG